MVAPAPTQTPRDLASSRAQLSQTTDVVAPPVSAPQRDLAASSIAKLSLPAPTVVAPPPSQVSHDLNSWGSARSGDLRSQPVPPPPSASVSGARTGLWIRIARNRRQFRRPRASTATPAGMEEAQQTAASRNGRGGTRGSGLEANAVVPPPPTVGGAGGGRALTGSGRGNKGNGTGSPLDLGSSVAPPGNNGNAAGNGVVVSSHPGSKVGLPNSNGGGAIAMSPEGTAKSGLGGSGGGTGIGRGNGPGSGLSGEGSGAGREGAGRGSDANARGGISPYPGPGGAGSGTSGTPAMPGVSVQGGTTTITLPSFGACEWQRAERTGTFVNEPAQRIRSDGRSGLALGRSLRHGLLRIPQGQELFHLHRHFDRDGGDAVLRSSVRRASDAANR